MSNLSQAYNGRLVVYVHLKMVCSLSKLTDDCVCVCVCVCRGEGGEVSNKKQLINTARLIVKESEQVVAMARKVAEACTDKRMKRVSCPFH